LKEGEERRFQPTWGGGGARRSEAVFRNAGQRDRGAWLDCFLLCQIAGTLPALCDGLRIDHDNRNTGAAPDSLLQPSLFQQPFYAPSRNFELHGRLLLGWPVADINFLTHKLKSISVRRMAARSCASPFIGLTFFANDIYR
jgi:hypothetical protein